MASDTILSNLFEIAQSEVDEILYFNDFVIEMRNNFKELTNDEYDSALLAINEQIKSGNKLMSTSAGKVTISNYIISKAIKTVEYEKQQKENYKINSEENRVSIEEVIITTAVLSQMIANYDNLSQDEKSELISNLDKVDITEMGNVLGKIAEDYENIAENTEKTENKQNALFAKEVTGVLKSLFDEYNAGNIEEVKAILKKHPSLCEEIEDLDTLNKNQLREVLEKSKTIIKKIQESFFESFSLSNKGELSGEEIKKAAELEKEIERWKTEFPKEYKRALEEYNKINQEKFKNKSETHSEDKINNAEKTNDENSEKDDKRKEKSKESAKSIAIQSDDKQNSAESIDEKKPKNAKKLQFEPPKNFYEVVESYKKGIPSISFQEQDEESKTSQIEEIPMAPLKVGFKSEEIKEAISQYIDFLKKPSIEELSPEEQGRMQELYSWVENFKNEYPKEYKKALDEYNRKQRKSKENLTRESILGEKATNSTENSKSEYNPEKFDQIIESYKKGTSTISFQAQDEESKINQIEEIPIALLKVGFKAEEIKEAITQYKGYFERASEDDLQFLSEQTDVELVEILKSEFQELEVDEEVGKLLNVMAEINYHGKIGEMLTNPKKREKFFSKLEQVANMDFEKFQDSVEVGEIKDSEVAELFERLSVELQVAPFEMGRETSKQPRKDFGDFTSLLQNSEVDSMYIVNGVEMRIDEEATRAALDAQERGEDTEKALLEYYEKLERENAGRDRDSEDKKEYVEPEIIVVDENGEQIQQDDVIQNQVVEEEGEELQSADGQEKNENIVVIKKEKEGKLQVFRPIQYLKKTSVAYQQDFSEMGVTFSQIQAQQELIANLVKEEQRTGSEMGVEPKEDLEPVQE